MLDICLRCRRKLSLLFLLLFQRRAKGFLSAAVPQLFPGAHIVQTKANPPFLVFTVLLLGEFHLWGDINSTYSLLIKSQ